MCTACTDLAGLSDEQLVRLASEVDETLCIIFKIDLIRPRTLAIEESLSNATTKAWKTAANRALNAALEPLLTAKDRPSTPPGLVRAFLKKIAAKLKKPLTAEQIKVIRAKIDQIYKKAKRISAKAVNVKIKFALRDKNAINAIRKQQVFWVGDFYSEHLSRRIQAVAEEIMLNQGLSSREGGKALREVLRREFGIVAGGRTGIAPTVPARFAGNPGLYFRGVSATSAHQARTFGSITAFSEARIVSYQIINPGDERTGQICQVMNGQVFSVQVGVKHMDRMLAAKSPADVRDRIAPWRSADALKQIVGNAATGSPKASGLLAAKGASLPPYHPL